jgi:hypothetical protein
LNNMRLFVLIVANINFVLGVGFALYGISIFADLGVMNTLLLIVFLWAILSGFCNLCVVYWVAHDEDRMVAASSGAQNARSRVDRLEGVVDDNFALVDERLKKLETQNR